MRSSVRDEPPGAMSASGRDGKAAGAGCAPPRQPAAAPARSTVKTLVLGVMADRSLRAYGVGFPWPWSKPCHGSARNGNSVRKVASL
jgi:hypothetical protein